MARPSVRSTAILGLTFGLGLAAIWFASTAHAQGLHDHGSNPAQGLLFSQEPLVGVAHGVTLGASVFLAGLVAFATLVWIPANRTVVTGQDETVKLFCRWMWALAGLLVVAGLAELPLYAVRASGESLSLELLEEVLLETRVGQLWIERLVYGLLAATAATYAARSRRPAYWWVTALGASALLLMTLTRQSHAAAEEGFLPFAADWLHVTAASLWMGGLLGFPILLIGPLRAVPAETRTKLLGRTVRRFSKVATIAVLALISTGLYAALLHMPGLSALADTPYGRALAMKLGLSVFLFAAGGLNLMLQGREPFGHLVSVELLLAIGVFLATGFLTSLPPADAEQPSARTEAPVFDEGLRQPPMPSRFIPDDPNTAARPAEEAAANAVVRLSGTPGTRYSGVYKGAAEETETADGTLGAKPTEYEVDVEDGASGGASGGVSAAFKKTGSDAGTLRLELLAGGEVVAERETSTESDTMAASWSPRTEPTGDSL